MIRYEIRGATLEDEKHMPRSEGWEFEIKWDGYRIVATVAGGEPELRTRRDQDYTKRFENVAKELVKALKTVKTDTKTLQLQNEFFDRVLK